MAKPLKDIAIQMGWDGKKDKRGRRLLQNLGTECGRHYNPNMWTDKWLEHYRNRTTSVVICDDVRFFNEASMLLSVRDCFSVKLIKPTSFWHKIKLWLGLVHKSERPLPDHFFHKVVKNDLVHMEILTCLAEDIVTWVKNTHE
jgi:hypothetical protein